MNEQELLSAIGKMLEDKLEPIKYEQAEMRVKMDDLAAGQQDINHKIDSLSSDTARLNHKIGPKLQIIEEGVRGILEKHDRLDGVERKIEDHGSRIFALEQERTPT